jgi:hypothetical protein
MLNGLINPAQNILFFGVLWQNGINDTDCTTTWNGIFLPHRDVIYTQWRKTNGTLTASISGISTFERY